MPVAALDVGAKRIGVAISDPTEQFALPAEVIERTSLREDLQRVVDVVEQYGAKEIVVGNPLRLSGEHGPAAEQMDRFVEKLSAVFDGTIHRMDERLTTAQAQKVLIGADVKRAKRKMVVDKIAAALILETFLARRRNKTL